ncbi:hypothetical protein FACS189465_3320 [Clostridia bacterium]|nr:hypothetical protein FACS189465_3320 [Clostridia bacterium]
MPQIEKIALDFKFTGYKHFGVSYEVPLKINTIKECYGHSISQMRQDLEEYVTSKKFEFIVSEPVDTESTGTEAAKCENSTSAIMPVIFIATGITAVIGSVVGVKKFINSKKSKSKSDLKKSKNNSSSAKQTSLKPLISQ